MSKHAAPRWLRVQLGAMAFLCMTAATSGAQEPMTKARELYTAAAYEEALGALVRLDSDEARQYRALCLLALGRQTEATTALEALITASPMFTPPAEEVPPRFLALVSDVKRKLLPTIARKIFADAREQFRAKTNDAGLKQFGLVVALTSDPAFKDSADAQDLQTLATGFIDLVRTAAAPAPAPGVQANAAATGADTPARVARAEAAPSVVQAVIIRQDLPGVPPEAVGLTGPTVSVRVQIDAQGKVAGASIEQSAHPLYDRLLLRATRDWLFKPATLNGRAMASEKVVAVQLR